MLGANALGEGISVARPPIGKQRIEIAGADAAMATGNDQVRFELDEPRRWRSGSAPLVRVALRGVGDACLRARTRWRRTALVDLLHCRGRAEGECLASAHLRRWMHLDKATTIKIGSRRRPAIGQSPATPGADPAVPGGTGRISPSTSPE